MNALIGQGFALCWIAAAIILFVDETNENAALVTFTAPLWIAGVLRLVEGLVEIRRKNGKGKCECGKDYNGKAK